MPDSDLDFGNRHRMINKNHRYKGQLMLRDTNEHQSII